MVNGQPGKPERRGNFRCRVVHHPHVYQADDNISSKVSCVRRYDVIAVGVSACRIDTETVYIVNAALQTVPRKDSDIVPAGYLRQLRQSGKKALSLYTVA